MSEEEKKAINNMKLFARVHQDMTVVTAKEMDIVLNLIEKQQKENIVLRQGLEENTRDIKNKNKIIDKMAEYIAPLKNEKGVAWTRIGVKEYFTKLVEEKNK